jgi:AcrR family transcriptional regulator
MTTKAEQAHATRAALLGTARALFAERGFAATSTEQLVAAAGVTRGALYYHYADKRALFEAVFEDLERELVEVLLAELGAVADDPLALLHGGVEAFLDACLDPAIQRIALLEAPAVLGWERYREIEQTYGLGVARAALQAAMDAGVVTAQPVEPLAHVLFGGLVEAALYMAAASDQRRARREVGAALRTLIDGITRGADDPLA